MDTNLENVVTARAPSSSNQIIVYPARWVTLTLYFILQLANSTLWVSFSPISDIACNFFGDQFYGNLTAINMLANLFLILYPIGTIFASYLMERYKLRISLLVAGGSTILGSFLRIFAAYYRHSMSPASAYWLIFFGQALAAIVQPIYINYPPLVSAIWFPLNERDAATTIGAMSNPIGNAIGSLIPPLLVSQTQNDDGSYTIHGMGTLMLVEFLINLIPFFFLVWLITDAPLTPPSLSTSLKKQRADSRRSADTIVTTQAVLMDNMKLLWSNGSYLVLIASISMLQGTFAAMFTLMFQIMDGYGYSNSDAGLLGFIAIIVGVIASVVAAVLMKTTRAYRPLVQYVTLSAVPLFILFFCVAYPGNFPAVCISIALIGAVIIPLLPITMENCAECTYPVPEELSTGILFTSSNMTGLAFTFALQHLAQTTDYSATPFTGTNLFIFIFVLSAAITIMFYKGEYRRLEKDLESASETDALAVQKVLGKAEWTNPIVQAAATPMVSDQKL